MLRDQNSCLHVFVGGSGTLICQNCGLEAVANTAHIPGFGHEARPDDIALTSRALDVIENPNDWTLGGSLIWIHRDGGRVTDQAVESIRRAFR